MNFIKRIILLSVVSFAFAVFNVSAAYETYINFEIGGITGYTSDTMTKRYTSNVQKIETLRANHKTIATLYGKVGSAREEIDFITIEKRINNDNPTFINQNFDNMSKTKGDYELNLKKSIIFGTTNYWGNWVYDL